MSSIVLQGVQGQADRVEQQAEARQQAGSPQQQSQATAVKQEVKEAAPKEDLEDTLSVLHGAGSDMQEQQPSQVLHINSSHVVQHRLFGMMCSTLSV